MNDTSMTSGRGPNLLRVSLELARTIAVLGILAALVMIHRSLGQVNHLIGEQLAAEIGDGPPPNYSDDGSTLKHISLERLPDNAMVSVGERRPILHGEWIHVSRYSERFESVSEDGKDSLIRRSVWIHLPSRTRVTLTYESPRQPGPR